MLDSTIDNPSFSSDPIDVLVFGAHPDDAEIGMGGTIAWLTHQGQRVVLCDLTRAECSSNGDPATRWQEALTAATRLGVCGRVCLTCADRGFSAYDLDARSTIVRLIRRFRPHAVCMPYEEDTHPDHQECARLVSLAVFDAALRKIEPDMPPWTVARTYAYFIHEVGRANVMIDVSAVYANKLEALQAYASQFDPQFPGAVLTRLNDRMLQTIQHRDAWLGGTMHCAYAEGFIAKQPMKLTSL